MSPERKPIKKALLSLYYKEPALDLIKVLHSLGVELYASSGTYTWLKTQKIDAQEIKDISGYPTLLGGRVKTLHPKIFSGLLYRSHHKEDLHTLQEHHVPCFDMLIVSLYPFEKVWEEGVDEQRLIEKIDVGGVALLRAGAKNFQEIWTLCSEKQYESAKQYLLSNGASSSLSERRRGAAEAFAYTSHYDTTIFTYFNTPRILHTYRSSCQNTLSLRYGENPHQKGFFHGTLSKFFHLLQGKSLSYNNLLDLDTTCELLNTLKTERPCFVIVKHGNPCGASIANTLQEAYTKAYEGDNLSAFGGVFATNTPITQDIAQHMSEIFFEVLLAPGYSPESIEIFSKKPKRILVQYSQLPHSSYSFKSILHGVLEQEVDELGDERPEDWSSPTQCLPSQEVVRDCTFAYKVVKVCRSNAIVLAKEEQILGCGTGQTSRVDALWIAIQKAKRAGLSLKGAVMASEAFFPFADCVEIAHKAGIEGVIQPGGSQRDHLSVTYCDEHQIPMIFTGKRHFKH